MNNYTIKRISAEHAKEYIKKNHYAHGCHNGPFPCYGLFDKEELIGCLMFATPCSEAVRASIFGEKNKDLVTELHRLHIMDVTPRNTESWFIVRCLKLLKEDKPMIKAVISFSDSTEGHEGTIYKATNAYRLGKTSCATFYEDETGRLRHPRQSGVNIDEEEAEKRGWTASKRGEKNRYLYLLPNDRREKKVLMNLCHYELVPNEICQKKDLLTNMIHDVEYIPPNTPIKETLW